MVRLPRASPDVLGRGSGNCGEYPLRNPHAYYEKVPLAPSDGMPRTTTSRRHAVVPLAIAVAFRRWTILRVLSNCKGLRITFYSVRHLRLLSLSPSQGPSRRNRTLAMHVTVQLAAQARGAH